ncbi:30S ribosomal protein S6 [Candidatus Peregrinibacteria bacterium]|nr:30S ribosomal protein S6 [Candidatus Peregrinibacteria bacterium]
MTRASLTRLSMPSTKENEAATAEEQVKYELMLILKPDLSQDDIDKQLKEIKGLIKDATGEIYHEDLWDVRDLAFTIKKYDKGYYVIYYFTLSDSQKIAEMEEELLLNNVVLRHLIVKSPKHYEMKKLSELELKEGDRRTHRVEKEASPKKQSSSSKTSSKKAKKETDSKPEKKPEKKSEEKPQEKEKPAKKEEAKKEETVKEEKKEEKKDKEKAMDISDLDSELESILDDPDINIKI